MSAVRCWWPPGVWMGVIFALSAQPSLPRVAPAGWEGLASTAAHVAEYLVLAWLLARSACPKGAPLGRAAWFAVWAVATGYGVTDEWHQASVPGRTPDPLDLLADAIGAAVGIAVAAQRARR